ncbi:MAG: alpha amylase catalytic region [Acidobacteriaceae bacterium]|nr:alpha amylase catalytic region [Acidobacteriaceae bacterium]
MEFHIARSVRERLDLNQILYSYTGNVIFANLAAARELAMGLNTIRAADGRDASEVVHGGALFAMGLIDELSHAMVARYRKEIDPAALSDAVLWFERRLGKEQMDRLLLAFVAQFPPTEVFAGKITSGEWLTRSTDGVPHRESEMEELLMLWLANQNSAFTAFRELFTDDDLKQQTAYPNLTTGLPGYFETRPLVSKEGGTLLEVLRAPMLASPDSLVGQLEFIREHWTPYLGPDLQRALMAIDVVREEDRAIWMRFHPPEYRAPGQGELKWETQGFSGDEYVGFDEDFVIGPDGRRLLRQYASDHQAPLVEYEAFSPDQAWMPTVVMIAKSTYVWLEQLSKKYLRHIHRLDQIPDEELRILAGRGMTALWLIGLWERSVASQTIKRLRGQADAVASAYSLKDYNIAHDLGGNSAYESLRDRAAAYGIRLASDMVPNHMGIDSPWVIDHPEWFITRPDSPFPVYRFDGPDLSHNSGASIKIEDHYYDQTDAAVAFRLHTYRDNKTQFMYHGNDGTTFAWNDTAQLDYSKANVREHIIQTILHVARLFPIIRFDAAMVLAKRHVQRLWFPLPGVGGSIPSRAENAMSQEAFDALMPNEFWREVVDRVAIEVPGTLLLAEAFWLLEGYFVRTLGMHRVYNSAFMNMLRDEENAKYRSYLKKTVEFDPDILKRYVNFMSNPDEKTAAEQFGSGDKYFGTCTLLATLPGLPMFAHGQIEGFSERYGMDFKEARLQETPDEGLIGRFTREITPLLRTRWLFAESTHFVLYDFWTGHGSVDENVFAYSNRAGDHRAVILYNNTYASTSGTIHISAASVDKGSGVLRQRSLAEALALSGGDDRFVAYRDSRTGLEYLQRGSDLVERGLHVNLNGYQYIVLLDWREVQSTAERPWFAVWQSLHGGGIYSLEEALASIRLARVHEAFRGLLSADTLRAFADSVPLNEPTCDEIVSDATGLDIAVSDELALADEVVDPEVLPEEEEAVTSVPIAEVEREDDSAEGVIPGVTESAPNPIEPAVVEENELEDPLQGFFESAAHFYTMAAEFFPVLTESVVPTPDPASVLPSAPLTPLDSYVARLKKAVRIITPSAVTDQLTEQWSVADFILLHADPGLEATTAWAPVSVWMALESLPETVNRANVFDELRLRSALASTLSGLGMQGDSSWRAAALVRVALEYRTPLLELLQSAQFWEDGDVQWLAGKHVAFDSVFVHKDQFETLLGWLQWTRFFTSADTDATPWKSELAELLESAKLAGYKLEVFQKSIEPALDVVEKVLIIESLPSDD